MRQLIYVSRTRATGRRSGTMWQACSLWKKPVPGSVTPQVIPPIPRVILPHDRPGSVSQILSEKRYSYIQQRLSIGSQTARLLIIQPLKLMVELAERLKSCVRCDAGAGIGQSQLVGGSFSVGPSEYVVSICRASVGFQQGQMA